MQVYEIRKYVGDKFFTVEFYKKNGDLRKMNARLGVKKHLKGGSVGYDVESHNYIIAFDTQKREYRTINLNTIKSIKCKGRTYSF